jgi:hypothetical protein
MRCMAVRIQVTGDGRWISGLPKEHVIGSKMDNVSDEFVLDPMSLVWLLAGGPVALLW